MRAWPLVPVLLLALPASAAEAPPWERAFLEADPAEVLAAARALPPTPDGAEVEVLLEEGILRFDERGRSAYVYRMAYRVLTVDAARAWASAGGTWEPWREARPEVRARVITADGVAHVLDPATLSETGAAPQDGRVYDDRRSLRGPLPAIAAGAVVEEETVYRDRAPLLAEGETGRFWFQGSPTRKVRLRLEAPAALPLRFAVHGIELTPRESREGGRRIVVFEAGPLARAVPVPDDAPPAADARAHVAWATAKSWADIAKAYHAIVERQVEGAEADVRELTAGVDRRAGADAVVATLLERIEARVRYTGLEFGEAAIVPRRPAETLGRRYGDCKDLSTLLAAALRSLGIEAHLALVSTGDTPPDPDLPGLGVFDHAIVALSGSPAKFVDPTDPGSRGRYLPPGVEGRAVLVAAPATKALAALPAPRAADRTYRFANTIRIPERGLSEASSDIEVPGPAAAATRAFFQGLTPERRAELVTSLSRGVLRTEAAGNLQFEDARPGEAFRIHLEGAGSKLGGSDENEAIAVLRWKELLDHLPDGAEAETERKHDLAILPHVAEITTRVVPPPGFALREPPAGDRLPLGPFAVTRAFEVTPDGALVARGRLDTGDRRALTAAEAEALRQAVRAFEAETYVHFDRIAAALEAAGKTREAIAEERRLSALHPEEALHRAALARMLLDAGLGDAARTEARRAIEVQPGSAPAHRTLGWILQHDLYGRRFKPGWDRDGAVAAYRKATELDPADPYGRADLAILLEHGTSGERYGPGADLDGAIALYRGLESDPQGKTMVPNLLLALLRAGRFPELAQKAAGLDAGPARDQLWIAAVAATDGLDAAVRKATAICTAGDARRSALASASQQLVRVRRYDLAAGLLERAAVGADNAHALQMKASLLARVRRVEDRPIAPTDPSSPFDRLIRALITPSGGKQGFDGVLARALRDAEDDFDPSAVAGAIAQKNLGDAELPRLAVADFGSSLVERSVSGDDEGGYRIRLVAPSADGQQELKIYVVREDDGYRYRADGAVPYTLGDEALSRADRGDLDGARRWLGWAVEGRWAAEGELDRFAAVRAAVAKAEKASADELRRAAAVLAATGPGDARFERALALRKAAVDPAEALALDQGLALAAIRHGRGEEAAALAERLAPSFPASEMLFHVRLVRYRQPGQRRAGVAALRPLAEKLGTADEVMAVAGLAAKDGDFATADTLALSLLESGRDTPVVLNELAWNALFHRDLDEATLATALERARRASVGAGNHRYASLHTLAALLAETGQVREAVDTLRTALDAKAGPPDATDAYVVARIAEQLGLRDEALALYRRLTPEADGTANGIPALASRRLEALAAAR